MTGNPLDKMNRIIVVLICILGCSITSRAANPVSAQPDSFPRTTLSDRMDILRKLTGGLAGPETSARYPHYLYCRLPFYREFKSDSAGTFKWLKEVLSDFVIYDSVDYYKHVHVCFYDPLYADSLKRCYDYDYNCSDTLAPLIKSIYEDHFEFKTPGQKFDLFKLFYPIEADLQEDCMDFIVNIKDMDKYLTDAKDIREEVNVVKDFVYYYVLRNVAYQRLTINVKNKEDKVVYSFPFAIENPLPKYDLRCCAILVDVNHSKIFK